MSKSGFVGAMVWGQVWRVGEVVLSLLFTVLVVRSLDETSFGVYSTLITFGVITTFVLGLGLSDGLVRYVPVVRARAAGDPFRLLRLFLLIRLGGCVLAAIFIWFGRGWLAAIFNQPFFASDSGLIVILVALYNLSDLTGFFYNSMLWVKSIVIIRLVGQLSTIIFVTVSFWLLQPSVQLLIAGVCLSNLWMLLASLSGKVRPGLKEAFLKPPPAGKLPLKEIFAYSRDLWLVNLATLGLLGQMDIFLLALLTSDTQGIGFYSLATLLISRLLALLQAWSTSLGSIVSTVYLEKGLAGLERYFVFYYRFSLPVQVIPMGGLALVAGPFIGLVFGDRYLAAVALMAVMAWLQISYALLGNTITTAFLNTLGRQRSALVWRCSCSLLNLGLDLLFIPLWGPLGAALGTGISMALLHLLEAWLVRELFLKINIIYILKIGGGVASGLWLSSFIGGAYLPSLLGRGFFYLAYLLVFFLLTKPLTALDLQHLNNLRPGAARFLRFFSLKPV
jgi:O-antigen/teichoic acid export membrane protein